MLCEYIYGDMKDIFCLFVCIDLFITTSGGGNVNIQKMESDVCQVQTDTGSCVLTSVRVCPLTRIILFLCIW